VLAAATVLLNTLFVPTAWLLPLHSTRFHPSGSYILQRATARADTKTDTGKKNAEKKHPRKKGKERTSNCLIHLSRLLVCFCCCVERLSKDVCDPLENAIYTIPSSENTTFVSTSYGAQGCTGAPNSPLNQTLGVCTDGGIVFDSATNYPPLLSAAFLANNVPDLTATSTSTCTDIAPGHAMTTSASSSSSSSSTGRAGGAASSSAQSISSTGGGLDSIYGYYKIAIPNCDTAIGTDSSATRDSW
jgi:hypothetical protein